jgi:general secretion pathway protein E
LLRRDVHRVVSSPIDINRYLQEFYGVQRSIQLAKDAKAQGGYDTSTLLNFEQLLELGKAGEVGADDRHVVHIVDWLLQYAFEQRASDIHLEPRREAGMMRFRIDGVMHKVFELPPPVMTAVTSRIKILSRMDVAEKRRPQDGRIKTRSTSGREVELRISSMPTAFGEKLVMRIFDPDIVAKDFSQLGFSPSEDALWRGLVERPHGIVLVTGPTGSGKTTTLYSTLKHLATPDINVCTVEDPIEMVSPEFNQMQVQPSIDLDFAAGVRTLLRQDPDIIMVGEIRDLETAQMAVQASLTGHLVLSTLHTNDAPSAVTRLLDLGVPHYLIQSTVSGIVAQRLVRTLCPHCKLESQQDPHEWTVLTHGWSIPVPERVFRPVGCLECRNTGFIGRTGIYEMMQLSPRLRGLICAQLDLIRFGQAALAEGMRPLRISAADQVARGLTTVQEVLTVLPPVEHIEDSPPA